jgi:hypothetical protein
MEWEIYDLDKNENGLTYEFHSEGPKGRIRKIIQFQHLNDLGKIFLIWRLVTLTK